MEVNVMRKGFFISKSAMFILAILFSILVLDRFPTAEQTLINIITALKG